VLVLDNSSTRSIPAVQTWLAQHPGHPVSFHAQRRVLAEHGRGVVWNPHAQPVRRASFDTVQALVGHIEAYIRRVE
jgi:hypothetical protein